MSEENPSKESQGNSPAGSPGELPEVYALKQDKTGWQFSRRDFLAASGAAVVALAAAGCGSSRTAKLCSNVRAHSGSAFTLRINPDGTLLASIGGDEKVKLWSLPEGELLNTLKNTGVFLGHAISQDFTLLALPGLDITFRSFPDGEPLELVIPEGLDSRLAINPDKTLLASSGRSNDEYFVQLWSLPDGQLLKSLEGATDMIYRLLFSPDGTILASGGSDDLIMLWSIPDGELLKTLEGNSKGVRSLAFSPDGSLLASGDGDGIIRLWSLPDGELVKTLAEESFSGDLAFSPDGSLLAAGNVEKVVKLWSLPDGELVNTLEGHQDYIAAVAFSPDGSMLFSGDKQGAIKMWAVPDGQTVGCPMDIQGMPPDTEGMIYEITDSNGETVEHMQACRAPLPKGAVCTCNCVAGGGKCDCVGYNTGGTSGHYWYPD